MKKIKVLAIAVAMLATTGSFAQKGWWLEGGLGYTNTKLEDVYTINNFNINLGANYMLSKDWSIGLNLGYDMTNTDFDATSSNDFKSYMLTITPQATYSHKLIGGLAWTPRIYFTYGMGTYTVKDLPVVGDKDYDMTRLEFGVDLLAVEFHATSHIAFGAKLGVGSLYFRSNDYDDRLAKETKFNIPLGSWNNSDVSLSFHYYL